MNPKHLTSTKKTKVLAVIPARLESSRLPRKPLIMVHGKSIINHTYDNLRSPLIDKKIIATDSKEILKVVKNFGGEALLTKKTHKNGTERVGEVVKQFPDYEIILNIQGDEPLVNPLVVKALIEPLLKNKTLMMSTLKVKIPLNEAKSPHTVKVITDQNNLALYFSRSLIPFNREPLNINTPSPIYYKHLGLYGFRRKYLFKYLKLKPTLLEKRENLEQLRILEKGEKIYVKEVKENLIDINTPKDILKFKKRFLKK